MTRSRRLALISAITIFTLSACGDGSTTDVKPATSGQANPGGTDAKRSPRVIRLGGTQTGVNATADKAGGRAMTAEGAPAMDDKMFHFANYTYVAGDGLSALEGTGPSWLFPAGVTPSEDRIRAIASAFGVTGDIVQLSADMGGGWQVGPQDGSAAAITVSSDGMNSWYFSPAWLDQRTGTLANCAVVDPVPLDGDAATSDGAAATGDGSTGETPAPPDAPVGTEGIAVGEPAPECVPEQPKPPVGVLTKDEALAKATELFTSLGFTDLEYEAYADEWSASVTAFVLLDGARSPLSMYVGYGENGVLSWASGFLATPERGDDYPLVSTTAGVDRLNEQNDQMMFGAPGARTLGGGDVAIDAVPADDAGQGTGGGTSDPSTGASEPMPIEPAIEEPPIDAVPEEVTITLTGVKLDMSMVWDLDGTVWLLPTYMYTDADGGVHQVNAVDDSFLEISEPEPTPEPGPVPEPAPEPLPSPSDTIAPPPVDPPATDPTVEPSPGDSAVPTPDTAAPVPDTVAPGEDDFMQVTLEDAQVLVGLAEADADASALTNGWIMRVVQRDGEALAVTMDLASNRVNVVVDGGVVTSIASLG